VAHGDAIVNRDGVELFGNSTGCLNLTGNQLTHIFEMHVPGHKLSKGVHDRDDRLTEVIVTHAGGSPKRTSASHVSTVG
jgi:hypothetical protein